MAKTTHVPTPAEQAGSPRYVAFHNDADSGDWRPQLGDIDSRPAIAVDAQADPLALACLVHSRARRLSEWLDYLAAARVEDVTPAELANMLRPLASCARLGEVLEDRLSSMAEVRHG